MHREYVMSSFGEKHFLIREASESFRTLQLLSSIYEKYRRIFLTFFKMFVWILPPILYGIDLYLTIEKDNKYEEIKYRIAFNGFLVALNMVLFAYFFISCMHFIWKHLFLIYFHLANFRNISLQGIEEKIKMDSPKWGERKFEEFERYKIIWDYFGSDIGDIIVGYMMSIVDLAKKETFF